MLLVRGARRCDRSPLYCVCDDGPDAWRRAAKPPSAPLSPL
ncbi:hypothetical protein SZ55_0249 [Pseudomonas sp. FeS53a]|nr:hypothetical protein SZ55_0249 [Pseudomonas sp. FeS53a]